MSNNKYALITGATSGIGRELAKLFAQDGYNLVIVARGEDGLETTSQELQQQFGVEVTAIAKDLFNREAANEVYNEVKQKGISIDVLVNDAGQGQYGLFIENDLQRELDIIQLNVMSLVAMTKHFVKDMVARGEGKILNLASIASATPGPFQAVYHGTKAFVLSFSEGIRDELKDTGVTVTALMPGATATDFFNKAEMQSSKIVQETTLSDPAKVAKDGYEALLSGDDKIVSGLKNKMMVGMSNVMPDTAVAANMHKQQEPVNENEKS